MIKRKDGDKIAHISQKKKLCISDGKTRNVSSYQLSADFNQLPEAEYNFTRGLQTIPLNSHTELEVN